MTEFLAKVDQFGWSFNYFMDEYHRLKKQTLDESTLNEYFRRQMIMKKNPHFTHTDIEEYEKQLLSKLVNNEDVTDFENDRDDDDSFQYVTNDYAGQVYGVKKQFAKVVNECIEKQSQDSAFCFDLTPLSGKAMKKQALEVFNNYMRALKLWKNTGMCICSLLTIFLFIINNFLYVHH